MDNFLPLSREVRNHWIYKDAEYLQVWIEMLLRARYSQESKTDMYEGVLYTIEYGQFIFGYKSWSSNLSISYQRLRTLIKKLLQENMIKKVKAISKLTIYEVVNYSKFNSQSNIVTNSQQSIENTSFDSDTNIVNNIVNNNQLTTIQQSTNSQLTTKEERKKDKKENIYTDIFNYYMELDLIHHKKGLTQAMKKAIDKAMKENNYTVEEMKQLLYRHKLKVEETKNYQYPIKKRRLDEFFGQKIQNSVSLICTQYEEGGKYYHTKANKPKSNNFEPIIRREDF